MGITLLCSDDIKEKPFHFMVITTVACVLCSVLLLLPLLLV